MNLISMLGEQMDADTLSALSGMIGEDESTTKSAVNAVIPTLVGAMATKGATESGREEMLGAFTSAASADTPGPNPMDLVGNFAGMLGGGDSSGMMQMGASLLPMLMGNKVGGAASMISAVSGASAGSSNKLMSAMLPLVIGMVMKNLTGGSGGGMNAAGLAGLLGGQDAAAAGPAGLASLLGGLANDDDGFGMDDAMRIAQSPAAKGLLGKLFGRK